MLNLQCRSCDNRYCDADGYCYLQKTYLSKPLVKSTLKVYLCGPINGRSDDDCVLWREHAKSLFALHVLTLDPMARDYRGREIKSVEEIVEDDLRDIQECDALLVMFDRPSVGAAMEVRYAHAEQNIPVFVVDKSGGALSPWLLYHTTKVFADLKSACEHINAMQGKMQ